MQNETRITIASVFEAREIVRSSPNTYRVISISSPHRRAKIKGAREILYLEFDDVTKKSRRGMTHDVYRFF